MIYHPQYDDEICEPCLVESRPASFDGIRVRLDERLDLPALRDCAGGDDELFTDPDREGPPFRPSER